MLEPDCLAGEKNMRIGVISDTHGNVKAFNRALEVFGGADMIVREPAGTRGGMFTASSITFGGSLLIDPVTSGIVKNAIAQALKDRSD